RLAGVNESLGNDSVIGSANDRFAKTFLRVTDGLLILDDARLREVVRDLRIIDALARDRRRLAIAPKFPGPIELDLRVRQPQLDRFQVGLFLIEFKLKKL